MSNAMKVQSEIIGSPLFSKGKANVTRNHKCCDIESSEYIISNKEEITFQIASCV
jgi:hypothetical protein